MIPRPPISTLFPYTTLFRSLSRTEGHPARRRRGAALQAQAVREDRARRGHRDRKSTRLNSSHANISYAVFCLKKKKALVLTTKHNRTKTTITKTILLLLRCT